MDFGLTPDQRDLVEAVRSFCKGELSDRVEARDEERQWSRELWNKCGTQGFQGLFVPEEYGGMGLDPLTAALVWETFGRWCPDGGLVFSVGAHLLANVLPIWKNGTEEQKRKYLPDLCTGRKIAAVGMTEESGGSASYQMGTKAVRDGDGWILRGQKTFITNARHCDVGLVYAATEPDKGFHGGITAFLIDRGTPGFDSGQNFATMGLRTCTLGELVLDDVRVGPEAVLGGPGAVGAGGPMFDESMVWERTMLANGHVGAMERLLDQAVQWARTRKVGGMAIGKHQAVSNRIADMKIRLESARLLARRAAWKLDRTRDVGLDAAMVKVHVSEAAATQALETIRVLGGYGYTADYEAERMLRDAVGGLIYSGTSDIQRLIVSRWVLGM